MTDEDAAALIAAWALESQGMLGETQMTNATALFVAQKACALDWVRQRGAWLVMTYAAELKKAKEAA